MLYSFINLPRGCVYNNIAEAAAANIGDDMEWEMANEEELEELRKAMESGGVQECVQLMERMRDGWKSIDLNVAVIGNSGVGKSSFINAIRGLTADDEGGAIENILHSLLLR